MMTRRQAGKRRLEISMGVALFLTVAAVLFLLVLPTCKKASSIQTVRMEKITFSHVQKGPFRERISVTGKIMPVNIVYLDAVEGGRVEKIFVESGSYIQQGDKILQLANTNLLMDIMFREAELFQQSNNLRNTRLAMEQYKLQLNQQFSEIENKLQQQRRVYERYKELEKDSLISRHEYELAKDQYEFLQKQKELTAESQKSELKFRQAQIEALEESLKRMQANLDVVKQRQENLTVVAPVTGQLTSLNAEIGESKAQGERLGQIDQYEAYKIRASIDERLIAQVKPKDAGHFELAGQEFNVDVKKIYPEVRDGKFEIDLEFVGERPPGLRRGQTLHIQLELVDPAEVLLLPRGDFLRSSGGKWVYVMDEAGKSAARTLIRLGRQNPQIVEVLEGVKEGDGVITSSYESFKNCERLILK